MSAPLDIFHRPANSYVVAFGKGAGVGVFGAAQPQALRRGDAVVVRSPRGTETGTVLCPATPGRARLLGATASGLLLRPVLAADAAVLTRHRQLAERVFAAARAATCSDAMPLEILDAEVLFDGGQAIVHFVGDESRIDELAHRLEAQFGMQVRLENLAQPVEADEEHAAGCGKPDCGQSAGGCSTCSTGGGCSSCGPKVDLREYFGHLREKMQKSDRRPLL